MTTLLKTDPDIIYPESDGQPMSENTEHYRWIVTIKENLEILFAADANVFVAGDLLWYPREKDLEEESAPRVGPDVMVIFGVPKGKRGSYLQWKEGNIAPQVVFEIRSPGNKTGEMRGKFDFYQEYGVEEYYLYDFTRFTLDGWQRRGQMLEPILNMNGWVSPRLGIRFLMTTADLEMYRPDGQKFLTTLELEQERQQAEQRAGQAEQRAGQAEQARDRERLLREQEQQLRAQAESKLAQLAASLSHLPQDQLRALGIDPELLK